jgi:hypothetical protein
MPQVPKKKSTETFQEEKTISRREALKRIALGVPMIATLPSCGGNRQNIRSVKGSTKTQYELVESSLKWLKRLGAPEELIKKLQPLQGKPLPLDQFAIEIERLIGKADFETYFPIIIEVVHHRGFNRGVECNQYLSCMGSTYTGDCCDNLIYYKYIRFYASLS